MEWRDLQCKGFAATAGPDILVNRQPQRFLMDKDRRARMPRSQQNKAWDDFVAWCQRRGLVAVPANAWTLAAYVRWCEPRQTPRAIAKAVKDISQVHEAKTRKRIDREPLVQRTLKMIETRRKADKPKLDLFDENSGIDKKSGVNKKTGVQAKSKSKPKPKTSKKQKPATASRIKRGLSTTPRLVSKRRLSR